MSADLYSNDALDVKTERKRNKTVIATTRTKYQPTLQQFEYTAMSQRMSNVTLCIIYKLHGGIRQKV